MLLFLKKEEDRRRCPLEKLESTVESTPENLVIAQGLVMFRNFNIFPYCLAFYLHTYMNDVCTLRFTLEMATFLTKQK